MSIANQFTVIPNPIRDEMILEEKSKMLVFDYAVE